MWLPYVCPVSMPLSICNTPAAQLRLLLLNHWDVVHAVPLEALHATPRLLLQVAGRPLLAVGGRTPLHLLHSDTHTQSKVHRQEGTRA
jgi:hypothetical protein